jgi:deoxyadenosine/deoxycytidine kinase
MAKIIEMIGAPGVGKTTLINALEKKWSKDKKWIPQNKYVVNQNITPFFSVQNLLYYYRLLLNKGGIDSNLIDWNGYEFAKNNPEFLDLCWTLLSQNKKSDYKNVDDRFRNAKYLFTVFGKYQFLSNLNDERVFVNDEFLLHRMTQITRPLLNEKEIRDFVRFVPKPNGLIVFNAPVNIILDRIQTRNRKIVKFHGLSDNEISTIVSDEVKKINTMVCMLKELKVSILEVDTTNQINHNVELLMDFIESI